jgi:O-succinylbenzoic acid--CoA ligase
MRCLRPRPPSLHALLAHAVATAPDAEAFVEDSAARAGRRQTYRQFDASVAKLAAGLRATGIVAGDRVALLLGNRLEFVWALFACARLGAVALPMNIRQKAPETAHALNDSGAALLLHEAALEPQIPLPDETPTLHRRIAVEAPEFARLFDAGTVDAAVPVGEEDCAVVLYTSGTTGRPKGAMLTHLGIVHSAMHFEICLGLRAGDRALLTVPASHVTGLVANILTLVHVAGCTVLVERFKAADYVALAAAERMTYAIMVPAMYNLCLLEPSFATSDLSAWRIGGYGGAPMPEATIAALAERLPGLRLANAYGATETTSPTTCMPDGWGARRSDSVGRVVPCGHVRVVGPDGADLPPGETGEIWIAGPMVVPGYWNNPAATEANFTEGCWRSGDLGQMDESGFVRVLDRIKDVINRAGYKIYSAEVENTLMLHPGVIECGVIGRPDPVLGERVHAIVLPQDGAVTADALRAFCAERLSDYKVPESVAFATEPLPRNANGKLIKTELRRMALDA